MIEFIDETSIQNGTPINRKNLMAIQGFINKTTVRQADGKIVQTNANGETLTTYKDTDGKIVQIFQGKKTLRRTITVNNDKSITEVIE